MSYLKRWESPRRQGRNDKGKGGSARAKQLKKRQQVLRNKLKPEQGNPSKPEQLGKGKSENPFPLFLGLYLGINLNIRTDSLRRLLK
ncbi:hypothetical protein WN50_28635 [Limnoraphis robusta CS-951]|uniref:Uncharacterized protein n=1 Tax=Limnoraphis robusta CS-951 TaxID=1637645 RepID=A0A0F5Y7W6_9CYAN|nr:hypothetical protein [Limnoraphis robusta]KKD34848.1 hypothetical protein WN50_28635 [Limnoraphis robusta CS-951]